MKKIELNGNVVSNNDSFFYDFFGIDNISPSKVSKMVNDANGDELEVVINSPGGDVFSGAQIYDILMSYPDKVTVRVQSIAASAASVIAMAGRPTVMSPVAQLMIHNVSSSAYGDYRDMDHMSEVLQSLNSSLAQAYKFKSGMSDEEIKSLMDDETWFTSLEAKQRKLCDEIAYPDGYQEEEITAGFMNSIAEANRKVASYSVTPDITKLKQMYNDQIERQETEKCAAAAKAKAELELLELEGVIE